MRSYLITAAILFATLATSASAHSVAESQSIADAWIAQVAPGHADPCPGLAMGISFVDQILFDPDGDGPTPAQQVDGIAVADGWVGDTWTATCQARVLTNLGDTQTCQAIVHERLHFVLGPEHVGPLAYDAPRPPACVADADRCDPDESCWNWAQIEGGTRRVFLRKRGHSVRVGPCRFAIYWYAKRIDWKRTKHIRGDWQARSAC